MADDPITPADDREPSDIAMPLPEQPPMDDGAGGMDAGDTTETEAEEEAAKLGDFA